jgi:hypothetical protein
VDGTTIEKALLLISRELRGGKRLRGWQQLHSAHLSLQIAVLQNATACATAGQEVQGGALGRAYTHARAISRQHSLT